MKLPRIVILSIMVLLAGAVRSQPAVLPTTVDVTAIGAATYTIPIEVVPGARGVQPSLAVAYNSVSGLGVLGARWSLQGLSSIVRTGKDVHFDGNIGAVAFNTSDRFALDGKRLLPMAGTNYHADSVRYCFEVEDFTRIERRYSNGQLYFRSISQDGFTAEYGCSADSRLVPGGTVPLAWSVAGWPLTDIALIMILILGQADQIKALQ